MQSPIRQEICAPHPTAQAAPELGFTSYELVDAFREKLLTRLRVYH